MDYKWTTVLRETIFGDNEEGDQVFLAYLQKHGIAYERTDDNGSEGWPILKFIGQPDKLQMLLYEKFGLNEWEIQDQYPDLNEKNPQD